MSRFELDNREIDLIIKDLNTVGDRDNSGLREKLIFKLKNYPVKEKSPFWTSFIGSFFGSLIGITLLFIISKFFI